MRIVKCKIVNEELAMWTVLILQNTTVPKCGVTRSAFGGDRDYRPVGKVILHIKTTFYEYIIFVPRKRMKQVTSAQINKIKLLLYILHTTDSINIPFSLHRRLRLYKIVKHKFPYHETQIFYQSKYLQLTKDSFSHN